MPDVLAGGDALERHIPDGVNSGSWRVGRDHWYAMLRMVDGEKPSWTAEGVAAERALLDHLGAVDDPFAAGMLTRRMGLLFRAARALPPRAWRRSITLAGLAGRVLWIDKQVAAALDAGVTQVAVVGAGYDSRAWRMARQSATFVELDHPATQRDKKHRAPASGVTYVEADLTRLSASVALSEHLDWSRPAMFVLEGVTMYLPEAIVRRQLTELAQASSAGSQLALDFHPPRSLGDARQRRQHLLQRFARRGSGEAFLLTISPSKAVALVAECGWAVDDDTNLRDAAQSLVPSALGLPLSSVNPHKALVAAHRP